MSNCLSAPQLYLSLIHPSSLPLTTFGKLILAWQAVFTSQIAHTSPYRITSYCHCTYTPSPHCTAPYDPLACCKSNSSLLIVSFPSPPLIDALLRSFNYCPLPPSIIEDDLHSVFHRHTNVSCFLINQSSWEVPD